MDFLLSTAAAFLSWSVSLSLLKEFPESYGRRLKTPLPVYFLFSLCLSVESRFISSALFFAAPAGLLAGAAARAQNKDKRLLLALYKMLPLIISQMKLGLGFLDAYIKAIKDVKEKEIALKLQDILEALRFQKPFSYPHPEIRGLIQNLSEARNHPQPLRRLLQLKEKIKIEEAFFRKSARVLFQLKLQSAVLSFLYLCLLIWTIRSGGWERPRLILLSFFFFSLGLFWIFKTGRKIKWSL